VVLSALRDAVIESLSQPSDLFEQSGSMQARTVASWSIHTASLLDGHETARNGATRLVLLPKRRAKSLEDFSTEGGFSLMAMDLVSDDAVTATTILAVLQQVLQSILP
jgi:hypothetical protein